MYQEHSPSNDSFFDFLLGVKTAAGELMLNPADSYVIGEGDQIIVLAEDDDTYCASITHTLIREAVPDGSTRGIRYVDVCPGGLDAIRNFSRDWASNSGMTLARFSSRDLWDQDVERILFCGWRFDMGNLLQVYSAVAPAGSEFWILAELSVEQRESELQLRGWECNNRVKVVHRVGACRRNVLAQLPLESFSSVIVGATDACSDHLRLSSRSKGSSEQPSGGKSEITGDADARVITVVMMIQDIITRRNNEASLDNEFRNVKGSRRDEAQAPRSGALKTFTSMRTGLSRARSQRFIGSKPTLDSNVTRGVIVGEIVDSRSRAMLSVVNSIDAVVASSELISKAVAMVSEDGSVNRFLNTLFDPHDSEITLEGVEAYLDLASNEKVSFFELMARGRNVGTIVLGYLEREIVQSGSDETSTIRYTKVALNPGKKDLRRGWHPDDLLIVLTPAPSGSSVAPSDFLSDIGDVRTMDMTREPSWTEGTETLSFSKRSKVRFRG